MDRNYWVTLESINATSPPARGAWIATCGPARTSGSHTSPPARGAWIATWASLCALPGSWVASREGGVDRNRHLAIRRRFGGVASREGGVDRNSRSRRAWTCSGVASREGGVDRNNSYTYWASAFVSVASREGAWIAT